jgi:thiol-disulfide isomerase/thioredoxin
MNWSAIFSQAIPYSEMLNREASPSQRLRWEEMHRRVELSSDQSQRLASFTRKMPVFVLNGAWCGDCINQCPIFDHFARATPSIDLRFLDRDTNPELRDALSINAGKRVPVVVYLSEDFHEVARYGDRTLARYRQMAETQLGPSCPTGIGSVGLDILPQVIEEWLGEFELVQLLLRLSSRLRQIHGD